MSREIKFRMWDIKNKRFVNIVRLILDQFGALDYADVVYNGEIYKLYPSEVVLEQDTGLKDKNGKEIYEGDIVEFGIAGEGRSGYVGYADEFASFEVYSKRDYIIGCLFGHAGKVIGNIHENSELLESVS